MAGAYHNIHCDFAPEVARITLNRPPLNIIDIPMLGELQCALASVASANAAKVLVIDHQGKAFSAGVSVQDHTPDKVADMIEKFHGVLRALKSVALPTLALVDGMALGGGCELAMFCDIVIASERATFGQPEVKLGVFPPAAAVIFPHLVGRSRTLELLLTGDVIDAAEAKMIGLVSKVFPADAFRQKADSFITKLTSLSGPVLKLTKRAIDCNLNAHLAGALNSVERLYLGELMQTEDAQEGLNAYLEKRKPVWKNR